MSFHNVKVTLFLMYVLLKCLLLLLVGENASTNLQLDSSNYIKSKTSLQVRKEYSICVQSQNTTMY
jgi:hypothetical protein